MAKQFDCEPYLRALEEQADSIRGAATGLLQAMETFKENAQSMVRTVDNLKKMIGMTRRAMVLAHGDRVVERVEVKREPESPSTQENWGDDGPFNNYLSGPEEDWDKEANEPSYTFEGRSLAIPAYRSSRLVAWGQRCPACGGRPLRCACSS